MVTLAAKRKAVARLKDAFGMSERRACKSHRLLPHDGSLRNSRPDNRELQGRLSYDLARQTKALDLALDSVMQSPGTFQ